MPEDKVIYEHKRNLERERYQRLMNISDDELRILNSNQRLDLTNHPHLELRTRSLDEKGYLQSWQYLDNLGAEYHELVRQGYGNSVENRNARQIEIAEIIVNRTIPYITRQVSRLVRGPGIEIYWHGKRRVVRIKNCKTPLQDLVQEGAAALVKKLHKYDSERANLAKFIDHTIVTPIQKRTRGDIGVIVLPNGAAIRIVRRIVEESANYNEAMSRIMEEVKIQRKPVTADIASALYSGIKKGYLDINMLIDADKSRYGRETYETYYLKDYSENTDAGEIMDKNASKEKVRKALKQLPPREQEIMLQRYGFADGNKVTLTEIGDKLGVSRERVRQLEAKALKRLRSILQESEMLAEAEYY